MTNINVPMPKYKIQKESTDHPIPVLKIKYIGSPPYGQCYMDNMKTITLYYPHPLTLQSGQKKTLIFPVLVETSLPCLSIIYGTELLFRIGLTCNITMNNTNDSLLSTIVYNYSDKLITFPPNSLSFYCLTVISTHEE